MADNDKLYLVVLALIGLVAVVALTVLALSAARPAAESGVAYGGGPLIQDVGSTDGSARGGSEAATCIYVQPSGLARYVPCS